MIVARKKVAYKFCDVVAGQVFETVKSNDKRLRMKLVTPCEYNTVVLLTGELESNQSYVEVAVIPQNELSFS